MDIICRHSCLLSGQCFDNMQLLRLFTITIIIKALIHKIKHANPHILVMQQTSNYLLFSKDAFGFRHTVYLQCSQVIVLYNPTCECLEAVAIFAVVPCVRKCRLLNNPS